MVRRLRDIDMTAFKLDLLNSPLSPDSRGFSNDPNELVDVYNSVLQETLDKHAPGESRSITLRPHAPWFTDELRELKREKRRCERAYRKSGLVVHEQIYRDKCRRYNMMLNQAKTQCYQTKIENADQKNLFRMIDGMFQVRTVPPLPSHDSLQQLTEKFSSYFIEKITKLHHHLTQVPVPVMSVLVQLVTPH